MSRLEIDFDEVAQSINTLHNGAVNKLSSVTGNVRSIGNGVDGQIKARRGIGGRLGQAAASAESIHQKLMSVETFMRQSSDRYQTMERQIQQRIAILGTIGVMSANLDAFNRISISDLELKIAGIENRLTAFIPALFDLIKDKDKPLDIRQLLVMAGSFVTTIGELTIRQIQLLVKTVTTPLPIDEDMLEALNREQYLYLVRLSMKEGPEGDWARQQLIEARALLDRLRIAYIGIGEKTAAMDMMSLYAALSNTAGLLQQLNSMGLLPEKEVFTPEELAAKYDYDDKRKGMVVINGYGEVISVNQENLDELLRRYKAERWGNLNPAKVYDPRFNRNIKDFLDYAISLGYDPRTFEYVGADIKDDPFAKAFVASQQGVSDKHSEEAKKLQDDLIGYISTGLDNIPGVGNFKSAIELLAGKTMAGDELSNGDKVLAGLGIGLPWLRRTEDFVSGVAKNGEEVAGLARTPNITKKHDEISHDGYYGRKEFRTRINNANYTSHGNKHLKARTPEEAQKFSETGKRNAQYLPDINNKAIEKEALQRGHIIDNGNNNYYFIYDTGKVVGYDNGQPTTWIRAELTSGNVYHGHPIAGDRLDKYLKRIK
ncbi:pre-toxin TG domain-containing protein [Paenibacillus tarimensis]|uniref:pre-toxin TG domain-containing protein n=3 Tax=Paenibacillus tarimensis TaxID=416012 RepID=UPI0039EF5B61